jgi:putative inorganic carbon (hco3(-)) transporter
VNGASENNKAGFYLFLLYNISYFANLTFRFPILGAIRFDFILGCLLLIYVFKAFLSGQSTSKYDQSGSVNLLFILLAYVICTLPFVQWPGTVLNKGLPLFLKLVVFYFFTVTFLENETQLKRFMNIYLILLLFIIFEPLYLYFTQGRLGYVDYSMGDNPFNRLTGVTSTIGGSPNGLANVVAMTLPILFFLYKYYKSKIMKLIFIACMPVLLFTLILTGSRSGLLAALAAITVCAFKTKIKNLGIIFTIIAIIIGLYNIGDIGNVYKERYMSIIDENAPGRSGAEGRIEGMKTALIMFSRKPIIGYGLGTYREANWNLMQDSHVSHDMYTGVLVELGVLGSIIFFMFILSIFKNIYKIKKIYQKTVNNDTYPIVLANILETVLITELVFAIFGSGLWYYIWYLVGGISVATLKVIKTGKHETSDTVL